MSAEQKYGPRLTVQQAQDQIDKARQLGYRAPVRKKGVATRNLERVFSTIVTVDGPSNREIATLLDLSPATVSGLVTRLEESQLVRLHSNRTTSQGRRPKPVVVDDRTRHTIGFEISAEKVAGMVMNLAGKPVLDEVVHLGDEVWTKAGKDKGDKTDWGWVDEDKIVDTIRGMFASLKDRLVEYIHDKYPDAPDQGHDPVVGIGVSVGGHVNRYTGEVIFAPDLRWGTSRNRKEQWGPSVQLRQRIRDVTGVDKSSIVVDNDANGRGAAYQLYDGGAYFNDAPFTVVLVTEVGVGAAHFIDDEIYRGATGKSLELGHIHVKSDGGLPCRCGGRGCLEPMSTRDAILALANKVGSPEANKIDSLEEASKLADAGQAQSVQAFIQAGTYLGTGLADLVNLFDTSRIVVTGPAVTPVNDSTLVVFNQHYDRAMREALHKCAWGQGIDPTNVEVIKENGEANGARGAACLVVHDMITGHVDL